MKYPLRMMPLVYIWLLLKAFNQGASCWGTLEPSIRCAVRNQIKDCIKLHTLKRVFKVKMPSHAQINKCFFFWFMLFMVASHRQKVGLCICFWPLLNIPYWVNDPQCNHTNFFVSWLRVTLSPWTKSPDVLQYGDHRRLALKAVLEISVSFVMCSRQEITRHVNWGNSGKWNFKNYLWFNGGMLGTPSWM